MMPVALIAGNRKGISLVELIVTLSILSILAALILPSAHLMSKRSKEIELRRNLRIIRNAIDDFKKTNDKLLEENKKIKGLSRDDTDSGYPKSFDDLLEHDFGEIQKEKKRFLRRVPCDPFNPDKKECKESWGLRGYKDAECSDKLGDDIYDVCSMNDGTAIDGSKYKDW